MLPKEKIAALVAKVEDIDRRMGQPLAVDDLVRLAKERAELGPVYEAISELQAAESERADLESLLADPDMADMAREEAGELDQRIATIEGSIKSLLLPKDVADDGGAILEIRAGTGGSEAALFAGDLFRMYERYADNNGWKLQKLSESDGEAGGYKEVVANITGKGVFARMKFESGVHRVQRVPATEASGRIHTSAATVAILPEAEEVDIDIKPEDIRLDTTRASSAGGQHANTTDSGVRLTHLPTGIVVISNEKSQHQNRARAMQVLRARLYDRERQKVADERAEARRGLVGSGDRSERIRTYNFPQGRVSDHRINLTLYKLEQVMAGESLDELVDALVTDHQATLLAAEFGE
jgi:peptide chain release factor 1